MTSRLRHALRAQALALLFGATAAEAQRQATQPVPIAIVSAISGEGWVHPVGGGRETAAIVGTGLATGDSLHLASGVSAVLLLQGGRVARVQRPLRVTPDSVEPRPGLLSRTVRTLQQVAAADLRVQPNRQGMIRPLPGAVVLRAPRNGLSLTADRPTFAWTPVPGAASYRLLLRGPGGASLRFEGIPDTVWTPPATAAPLAPGSYSWTVAAEPSGRPGESQAFRIPAPTALDSLRAEIAVWSAATGATADELLLPAAVAYHDAGFSYEADRLLTRLLQRSSRVEPHLQRLRSAVLAALGEPEASALRPSEAGSPPR